MPGTNTIGTPFRRAALGLTALAAFFVPALPAGAEPSTGGDTSRAFVLTGATSTEGIAAGEGDTFFAGDRLLGDIYRGDISDGSSEMFIDAPEGRAAIGMKVDVDNELLFVAGGATGQAYVYNTRNGKTVGEYQLATGTAFINDVTLTHNGAWFTNSRTAELYFLPVSHDGDLGDAADVTTLPLTGPAAAILEGTNLNGIATVHNGKTLIVAHTALGSVFTVDRKTGATALIEGLSLPNADGLVLEEDTLWAVQNRLNQVSRIQLSADLRSGEVREVITSTFFQIPTTAALFDDTLALVNAKFGIPDATVFEVVLVRARSHDG
jgi:sugar lactone lactonase YvrE